MKHAFALFLVLMMSGSHVLADWDPELEAREQAEREAEQRASQEKERQVQQMRNEAQARMDAEVMRSKRDTLGAAAVGKSDAEVSRLYDEKIRRDTAEANKAAARAREALSSGQGAAALQQVTGKTLEEMENMSDEEADALAREMERKYGGQ